MGAFLFERKRVTARDLIVLGISSHASSTFVKIKQKNIEWKRREILFFLRSLILWWLVDQVYNKVELIPVFFYCRQSQHKFTFVIQVSPFLPHIPSHPTPPNRQSKTILLPNYSNKTLVNPPSKRNALHTKSTVDVTETASKVSQQTKKKVWSWGKVKKNKKFKQS